MPPCLNNFLNFGLGYLVKSLLTIESLIGQSRISKKFDLVHPGVPVMLLPLVVVYVEHTCKIVSGNSDVVGL